MMTRNDELNREKTMDFGFKCKYMLDISIRRDRSKLVVLTIIIIFKIRL